MSELAQWGNFYVFVGSASGALIGLQFVVMTLIAQRPQRLASEAGAAFGTPTVVHFSAALLLSAIVLAPWRTLVPAAVTWGLVGVTGFIYAVIVARRMRKQTAYKPEFEDWLFHAALPLLTYGIVAASAFASIVHPHEALFAVGADALLLLFIGIHNSWDAVAYHVFVSRHIAGADDEDQGKPA